MKDLFILFSGKTYGDKFYYAIQEKKRFSGEIYYVFGKVYHDGLLSFFDMQGISTFNSKRDAIKAVIKFSGKKLYFPQIKRLLSGKSLVKEQYYIKITTKKSIEVTPDLYTAKNVLKEFNEFRECWNTLHGNGYKFIELYKIGCDIPKRIIM